MTRIVSRLEIAPNKLSRFLHHTPLVDPKIFTLCPPADVPFLHEGEFDSGTFRCTGIGEGDGEEWVVDRDMDDETVGDSSCGGSPKRVRWIESDIDRYIDEDVDRALGDDYEVGGDNEDTEYGKRYPLLRLAHPIRVEVSEGEMLYLPSLWYHSVTQTCETVGMNFWYDMQYTDPRWCYFNFLQKVKMDE